MAGNGLNLATKLLRSGDSAQAVEILRRDAVQYPMQASIHALLAIALEEEGRLGEACRSWQDTLYLVPNSATIRQSLQRALARRAREGQLAAAEQPTPIWPVPAGKTETTGPGKAAGKDENELPDVQPGFRDIGDERYRNQGEPPVELSLHDELQDEATAAATEELGARSAELWERTSLINEDLDLDRLIQELEGARITPRPSVDDMPAAELEDDYEEVVTETLARIYASQGKYEEAARIYDQLARQQPHRSSEMKRLANEMRTRNPD
jgi:tetratricopeptide (TPR) repeat protein